MRTTWRPGARWPGRDALGRKFKKRSPRQSKNLRRSGRRSNWKLLRLEQSLAVSRRCLMRLPGGRCFAPTLSVVRPFRGARFRGRPEIDLDAVRCAKERHARCAAAVRAAGRRGGGMARRRGARLAARARPLGPSVRQSAAAERRACTTAGRMAGSHRPGAGRGRRTTRRARRLGGAAPHRRTRRIRLLALAIPRRAARRCVQRILRHPVRLARRRPQRSPIDRA